MIKIVAKVLIKEEMVEAFQAVTKPLLAASVKDKGNVYYTLNASVENPRLFAFLECWETQADLDVHMKTEHFTTAMAGMEDMTEEPMSLEVFVEV